MKRLRAFPGILVDFPNAAGETALMHAAGDGYLGVCRELLRAGADGQAVDNRGANAVHWALRSKGFGAMIGVLVQQLLNGYAGRNRRAAVAEAAAAAAGGGGRSGGGDITGGGESAGSPGAGGIRLTTNTNITTTISDSGQSG